jgi:hypothetical protein
VKYKPAISVVKGNPATVINFEWLNIKILKVTFNTGVEFLQINKFFILKLKHKDDMLPHMFLSKHWVPSHIHGKYLIGKTTRPLNFNIFGRASDAQKIWKATRLHERKSII